MIALNNMLIWHDLPAIIVGKEPEKKIVPFSNIKGNFVLCEIPYSQKDNDIVFAQLFEQGFFDCLNENKEYIADELTVILSLTERCNCRCRYCFLDAENQGAVMTTGLLHRSIEKAFEIANGRCINFSAFGGEPTAEPDSLFEMVRYAKEKSIALYGEQEAKNKIKFSITTNGLFNDNICNFLIDNRFAVSLSMDGIPEVQNFQRPLSDNKESYSYVEKNIQRLAQSTCKLKIRCTVTTYSVNFMVNTVKWLHSLGVKRIHFEPVTLGGRGCTSESSLQPPIAATFVNNLISAIEEGTQYGMDIICFPYMNMMVAPIVFCDGRAENRLVISPRGVVSSCVEVQTKEHELYPYLGLGEYNTVKNQIEFSHDQRREGIRGCHALMETKTVCKYCPLKFFCGGGCPTRNYRGTGSTDVVDQYRCDIIRLVMPYILEKFYRKSVFIESNP